MPGVSYCMTLMHPRKPIKGCGGLITNWRWSIKFRGPPWQLIKGLLSPAARDREKNWVFRPGINYNNSREPSREDWIVSLSAKVVPVIDPWLERLRSWGSSWGHLGWWTLYINSRSLKSSWLEGEACSFLIRACSPPLLENYWVITASQGNVNTPQHLAVSSPLDSKLGKCWAGERRQGIMIPRAPPSRLLVGPQDLVIYMERSWENLTETASWWSCIKNRT